MIQVIFRKIDDHINALYVFVHSFSGLIDIFLNRCFIETDISDGRWIIFRHLFPGWFIFFFILKGNFQLIFHTFLCMKIIIKQCIQSRGGIGRCIIPVISTIIDQIDFCRFHTSISYCRYITCVSQPDRKIPAIWRIQFCTSTHEEHKKYNRYYFHLKT